jgi:hypothetical protein
MSFDLGTSRKKYWAADNVDKPDSLISDLDEKVKLYQRFLRGGTHWRRMLRNLRYYHGNFYPYAADSINFDLKILEGGHLGVAVNHYRNIVDQILLIATGDSIKFKTRATNTDSQSLIQAALSDSLLDYYDREQRVSNFRKTAAQHGMIMNVGYTFCTWDTGLGQKIARDDMTGETFYQGDFRFENPTVADVAFDFSQRNWNNNQWVIVRLPVNRWDLVAKFPQAEEKIINATRDRINDLWFYQGLNVLCPDDIIYEYQFFHKKTEAMPQGRHVRYIPGTLLLDEQMPYEVLPLFRCVHGEFLLNCLGYSVANDLQVLQECENGAVSAISTALAAHGVGHIWMKPGDRLTAKNFEGGLRALVSENQPEPINFTSIPPELWKAADMYVRAMEYLSGINAVRRGQPEANLRTGKALQLVAAQAIEAASAFSESYRVMSEDMATHMIRCIRKWAQGSRTISILGKNNLQYLKEFVGQDLENIDRVVVESINPLAGTLQGRLAMADDLASKQIIHNYREYISIATAGTIEPILEYEQGHINLVREENEQLSQGKGVLALPTHLHVLHIKEHSTVLSTLENCQNPMIAQPVLAHIMEHITMWLDPNPNTQALQAALSGEPPPFTAPTGPGAPPGGGGPSSNPKAPPSQTNGQSPQTNLPSAAQKVGLMQTV